MKACPSLLISLIMLPGLLWAEVTPVSVRAPEAKAWIGQRVPFFVELRSAGSFAGSASFDLPQLPGILLLKVGSPVVDSQSIEGKNWTVQIHEFALFSQKPGELKIPPFSVRFSRREAFTGPAIDIQTQTSGWIVQIKRPPGSESIGFLMTTESFDLSETWEPEPGAAQVGAIFKRTIVQRAFGISGMALAPATGTSADGIRVYPGNVEIKDLLERGDFLGERRETMTYLIQKPGTITLPEIRYVWWNPKTEQLQSKTLPAVSFEVAPLSATPTLGKMLVGRYAWLWLLALAAGLIAAQRRRLVRWARQCWKTLNPPERRAARKLLHACRLHDAASAESAWIAWRNAQNAGFKPSPKLSAAVLGLQRHLFGPQPLDLWRGDQLADAFRQYLDAAIDHSSHASASILPLLNPGD